LTANLLPVGCGGRRLGNATVPEVLPTSSIDGTGTAGLSVEVGSWFMEASIRHVGVRARLHECILKKNVVNAGVRSRLRLHNRFGLKLFNRNTTRRMRNWEGLVSHLSSSQNVEGKLLESTSRSIASGAWRACGPRSGCVVADWSLEAWTLESGEDE
jgi:hypothetical protein